jgi:hypothetical protein
MREVRMAVRERPVSVKMKGNADEKSKKRVNVSTLLGS